MPAKSSLSILTRQRALFEAILSPPSTSTSSSSTPPARQWRILVCDKAARAVVTALFKPPDLRRHGITLHAVLTAPRGPVPDMPAVYVIAPTPENIAWLLRDLAGPDALYDRAAVCFTSAVSRPLLSALAAQMRVPAPVTAVFDLYADFVSLEHDLFSLHMPQSYVAMKASDHARLKAYVDAVVSGIFSVLVTLGVVPIIRAQRGGPAEAIAAALDEKIRDGLSLFETGGFASRAFSFRRPLLLLLHRDFDFTAPLHHTWTYQALLHDVLETGLNSVTVGVGNGDSVVQNTYALDKDADFFWDQHAPSPFPSVAEAIEGALAKYRADVEEINTNAGGGNASAADAGGGGTSHLAAAIATLPELSKRKEIIDVHTNIATALLENINKRALDAFFELESHIMANSFRPATAMSAKEYKAAVVELLKGVTETASGEKRGTGTANDRLRLFLIYYSVFGGQLPEKTMAEFRGMLHSAGADTAVIEYVGKLKGYQHASITEEPPMLKGTLNTAKLKGLMTNVVSRGYRSITNVAQNAKQLIVEEKRSFPVSRTLSLFMSEQARARHGASANAILDGYLMFDPKVMPTSASIMQRVAGSDFAGSETEGLSSSEQKMRRMLFSDAIVFTVGGGNYVEYDNCMQTITEGATSAKRRNVLYGTTELVTPDGFLDQLSRVAKNAR